MTNQNLYPCVTVVVLSYNRPQYLRRALTSIVGQSYPILEVLVVDNASSASDEIEEIARSYEYIKLIRNKTNLGFTGGMNIGISAAVGEYVYLTEDDIVMDTDCLLHLVEYAASEPATGLLSPVMYNEDGTIRCAGGNFSFDAVCRTEVHGWGESDTGQFRSPFGVTYIPGASMFARREFLMMLGGFRDDFFMYFEDVELCVRVKKSGQAMIVVPRAKIRHLEPGGASNSPLIEFHKLKNLYSTYLLHAPLRILPEFVFRYGFLSLARSLRNSRRGSVLLLKAWGWTLLNAPSLFRGRQVNARALSPDR